MTENVCTRWLEDGTLEKWVDNDIDASLRREISHHLEECPTCRNEVEALRIELDLIRESIFNGVEERTTISLVHAAGARSRPSVSGQLRYLATPGLWVALAASIVLILGLSYKPWQSGPAETHTANTHLNGSSEAGLEPVIQLASVEARPGEEVTIDLKVANLEGLSGLKAEVVFNPDLITIQENQNSLAQCGIKEDRVVIATLSQDAWKDEGGIAFRLPVTIRHDTPSDIKIDLRIEGVQLSDHRQVLLKPSCRDGVINVL